MTTNICSVILYVVESEEAKEIMLSILRGLCHEESENSHLTVFLEVIGIFAQEFRSNQVNNLLVDFVIAPVSLFFCRMN